MTILKNILGSWYEVKAVRTIVEIVFIILPIAFLIRTVGFGLYQVPSGSMETTLLVGERFFADKFSYWVRKPRRGEIISFNDPKYPYSSNKFKSFFQHYVSFNVSNITKRIIGLPRDHVKGVIENGHPVIYVNGQKLDESAYVNKYPLILLRHKDQIKGETFYGRKTDVRSFDPSVAWDKQPFYKIDPRLIVMNKQTQKPYLILEPGTPQTGGIDTFDITLGENQYWVMGDNRLGSSDSREWGPLDGSLIHGKLVYRIWSMDTSESYLVLDLLKHPLDFWKKVRWNRCFQSVH